MDHFCWSHLDTHMVHLMTQHFISLWINPFRKKFCTRVLRSVICDGGWRRRPLCFLTFSKFKPAVIFLFIVYNELLTTLQQFLNFKNFLLIWKRTHLSSIRIFPFCPWISIWKKVFILKSHFHVFSFLILLSIAYFSQYHLSWILISKIMALAAVFILWIRIILFGRRKIIASHPLHM